MTRAATEERERGRERRKKSVSERVTALKERKMYVGEENGEKGKATVRKLGLFGYAVTDGEMGRRQVREGGREGVEGEGKQWVGERESEEDLKGN